MIRSVKPVFLNYSTITLHENGNASITFISQKQLYLEFAFQVSLDDVIAEALAYFKANSFPFEISLDLVENYKREGFVGPYLLYGPGYADGYKEFYTDFWCLKITNDEMMAEMALGPGKYGFSDVMAFLKMYEITEGVMIDEIKDQCNQKNGEYFVMAMGMIATSPLSEAYDYLYQTHKVMPLPIKQGDRVGFLDLTIANEVIYGQTLVEITSGIDAEYGKSVTGKYLPKLYLEFVPIEVSQNCERQGNKIVATKSGIVGFFSQTVRVLEMVVYNELPRGLLELCGFVIVRGNVQFGTELIVDGDLVIHGIIEGAKVQATGDIYVLQGVIGKSSMIKAAHNCFVGYCNNSTIESVQGNVYIGHEVIRSYIKAKKKVKVEQSIIASKIESEEIIAATTVGAANLDDSSELILFENNELVELQKAVEGQIEKERQKLARLNMELAKERANQSGMEVVDRSTSKLSSFSTIKKMIEDDLFNLVEQNDQLKFEIKKRPKLQVTIYSEIYKGVKIVIGKQEVVLTQEFGPSVFCKGAFTVIRSTY